MAFYSLRSGFQRGVTKTIYRRHTFRPILPASGTFLLAAQHARRIEAGGAEGGHQAGHERRHREEERHAAEDDGIGGPDAEDEPGEGLRRD
jgi:hypothetical protein